MKLQNSPKLFALVTKKKGKYLFLLNDNGEIKFADQFGAYCLYFLTKGEAKKYIRDNLQKAPFTVIPKKLTNIPKDQIKLVSQDEIPKNSCMLVVIGEDNQKLYVHFDQSTKDYRVQPQKEGACVFTKEAAEQMKDGMKIKKSGEDVEFQIEMIT